jgi:acetoin utilization protein AcuB
MTVAEIMTTNVLTAGMDDTLDAIRKIFHLRRCHHIPIVEENRLVGIVSDRDVLKDLSPHVDTVGADIQALNTLKKKAHQVMTRRVITISPEDSVEEAANMMLEGKFNCLPVLERSGTVAGMITKTDILRSVFGKK